MTKPPTPPSTKREGATAPASRPARFAGLDGLRAIAVIVVMAFHLSPGFMPGGYLGVDVFFVLSGFLITSLLLREKDTTGRIRLGDFWRRRARRLLPALTLLVLACCTAAWAIGGDVLVGIGKQVLGAGTFSSNWLAIAGGHSYFDETTPELFRNLWSLAVEEQFYLLWPLIVLLLLVVRRRRIQVALVASMAIASAALMALLFVPGGDATRVYYGTDTHSFGLALGAVLAIVSRRWSPEAATWPRGMRTLSQVLGAAAIAGLVAASALMPADAPLVYRGGLAGVAVLTALAVVGSIVPGSLLGRVLDVPPMRWIGERSYGLYLWHWPAFVLVVALLPTWERTGGAGWALGGIALAISVAASALSYRFLEQPVRRRGFRGALRSAASGLRTSPRSPRRLLGVAMTASLLLGMGATTVAAVASAPAVGAAQAKIEQGQAAIAKPPPPIADDSSHTVAPAAVPEGDKISAIGDSVMLASAPELQAAFPGIQINAVVSRQLVGAPAILQQMVTAGTLRQTLLIGLGTNGPISAKTLEEIRSIAGPGRQIVLVNVQAPRGWTPEVNATLTHFAQQYRDVELANWRDAIAGHLGLLARDQIHPGSKGGQIYAAAVKDALQRLAELPPLLAPKEYGLAPAPV
jgi:peptidoglycan/LPS O-acetylase OafA/YrhL